MQDPIICRAAPADAVRLTEIAHASKRHWNYPEEWIERWSDALTIQDDYVIEKPVFVGISGQDMVGFYALSRREETWDLDHFWIHPDFMRRGFGRTLFQHAVSCLASVNPNAILEIESDPHAEAFYLRMGAVRVGSTTTNWNGLMRTLPILRYST